jgi:hypothetical protein
VTAWIMTKPDRLADNDKASLDAVLGSSSELAAVASAAAFCSPTDNRKGRSRAAREQGPPR